MALTQTRERRVLYFDENPEPLDRGASARNSRLDLENPVQENDGEDIPNDKRTRIIIRVCVFVLAIGFLIAGRLHVPDNNPVCVVDKVMDWFQGVNDFILANPGYRDALQIICSLFMDTMFLSLGGYWIYKGTSSRLVVSLGVFYVSRSLVQMVWFSPFTKGYWWYDPGFPSIVVPYGRGSDFFFSGHVGFVTICICEWYAYGNKLMVTLLTIGGMYTAFILISYQVHYSIDIFVGVIFGHWVFMMVDRWKDVLDGFLYKIYFKSAVALGRVKPKKSKVEDDMRINQKLLSNEKY